MLTARVQDAWPRDLPVCFPTRGCVDVTPYGADVIDLTTGITPASGVIAAICWAAIGASLVLIAIGPRLQWRGSGARPWLVALAVCLVPAGVLGAWAIGARLAELAAVFAGADGRPSTRVPPSLVGAWPLVEAAGDAAVVIGAAALFLTLNTAAIRERRARRAGRRADAGPRA